MKLRIASLGNTNAVKHGHAGKRTRTRTYRSWVEMRYRCRNKKARAYARYGGRGIVIDPAWNTYEQFLRDMGECPTGLTLDRADNNAGYTKTNCRWASYTEQNNNRRGVKRYALQGKKLSLREWARELRINYNTLYSRLRAGWTLARALEVE